MNDELNGKARRSTLSELVDVVGGLAALVAVVAILYFAGSWLHERFFVNYSKPWWNGTAYQQVCSVHVATEDAYCNIMAITVQNERITTLVLPDSLGRNSESIVISTNDCGKSDHESGSSELESALAGKGKRYCYIQELGGGREWQVNEL